ncbi:MAG: inositol monophosphatase [Deltaproteobacteria bacterium]|nr:inositol monophosphatase [Deltaproteobacteria bacterium]
MRDYTQPAIEIAKEAGQLQIEKLKQTRTIEYKGKFNIVTEVDKACEKLIVDFLRDRFPSHDILAEEGTDIDKSSEWLWIIDPLDGTVNYSHRYPLFSVSIALLNKGRPVVGVVYEPNRDELFVAEKGGGALLNDKPIRPSKTKDVYSSMIATGFAYNVADVDRNNMNHFSRFIKKCHALRRDGVASTDLCYTACGRYDGFWELFLRPWDIAAASLIVEEAGGRVSSFNGGPLDIFGDEILASNGMIHEEMLGILKE